MNILEAEDMVKGLPDQVLFQYAQNPPPQIPQFLAVSEVQRRQDMRQRFQASQQQQQQTVKDQILQGGIASAGGPPPGGGQPQPMAPMGAAPPGAPMQQPMTGAPMPPMGMSDGGRVPGQGDPQVFREFMRRNFATPQGIASNIGLVGGAMLGGPIGAGIGGNLGTYIGQKLTPPAQPLTPFQMMSGGLRAPEGGAVGGGGGGGLPYGGPTSYAGGYDRNQLIDLMNQLGDRKKPTVTVEEIPQSSGMAVGGIVPHNMYEDRVNRFMGQVPGIFSQVQKMMPATGGISSETLNQFRPTEADYINPQIQAQREALLTQLRTTGETRRAEDIAAAQRALTEAEAPIKQAQEEARKSAIASTLMRLGAGVMAGKPEAGLAGAAESVESIMSRAREQASAERRAARTEFRQAERAATQAARGTADAAFQMQAQNITADENKQQQFVRDQKQFAQWAFGQMRDAGRDARQAQSDAVRLSLSLAQTIDNTIRQEAEQDALNRRNYASTYGTIFKEVMAKIENADFGKNEDGEAIVPTAEQMISLARAQTINSLEDAGLYSTASVINVKNEAELNALKSGQRYRGPDGLVRIKP